MALPSIEDLLLKTPLYEEYKLETKDIPAFLGLQCYSENIDFHCVACNKESTFQGINELENIYRLYDTRSTTNRVDDFVKRVLQRQDITNYILKHENRIFTCDFECTRQRIHKATFVFYKLDTSLIKIGQYPSIAALDQERLKKYRKILSAEQYKELNRGIGLTAHGVGIGAFVYLRRIFENLIAEAYQKASVDKAINDDNYKQSRMDEKIQLLKGYVPAFLYSHRGMYGILSKGVHELSENECLEYFPVLQTGIEIILDQKYEEEERKRKEKEIAEQIAKIQTKLK